MHRKKIIVCECALKFWYCVRSPFTKPTIRHNGGKLNKKLKKSTKVPSILIKSHAIN